MAKMVHLVKMYADLIEKGLKTLEEVPSSLRSDVEAELARRASESD